ncbi:hypothetical protein ECZU20_30620 [Escherichia coli]|nr:hypothetical protein ECZU20_30620 [Escherichia coli]
MVDLAGNVGATGSQSAQIDTVNPAQVLTIASISTDTGSSATDFITSDTSLTLTGSLGAGLPAAKWRRLASTAARHGSRSPPTARSGPTPTAAR